MTVLETERRLRLAEQAIITNTSDVWNTRIDLFLALGGDWGTDSGDPAEPRRTASEVESGRPRAASVRAEPEAVDSQLSTVNFREVS